ncbi:MAG: aryl-sulfate sulfotransferase [Alphaproteobacteria bacterium]|nr:aryl-sulfate sulfotransferase [Alphaproteobacteria bacterium]
MTVVWWLLACHGNDGDTPPTDVPPTDGTELTGETGTPGTTPTGETGTVQLPTPIIVSGPTLGDPLDPRIRLVRMLSVATDVPTRAQLLIDDGDAQRRVTFPELATAHELPILGLYQDTDYQVTVTLTGENGQDVETSTSFRAGVIPEVLPIMELLIDEPNVEPGIRIIPIGDGDIPFVVLGVDHEARPLWALATRNDTKAVSFDAATGRFGYLQAPNTIRRETAWGSDAAGWAPGGSGGLTAVAVPGFHHEAAFESDGTFWSLYNTDVAVSEFPVSEQTPLVLRPATISSDTVVHIAEDGTVMGRWPLDQIFPTTRIGYDSLEQWAHPNAIIPLSDEDAFIVSMRHQDAVARVRQSTSDVEWVLANHDGWPTEWNDKLLTPIGTPFGWQYHQHAPFLAADGSLYLYDNGNNDRTTPYSHSPSPLPPTSRLVQFTVDPIAMTVEQGFSYVAGNPPLYSQALGNCDVLPATGHVYGTFAYLYKENGVDNATSGFGRRSVRLIEVDPTTGTAQWDLRLKADIAVVPNGYQVDRSFVIDSLYPADVVEEWLP